MTTHLEDIRTFLGKVHTVATAKHVGEHGDVIDKIVDASFQRILVYTGEPISSNFKFYTERYKVGISETSEANLIVAFNNIIDGIEKHNNREAITGWVYASYPTLCSFEFVYGMEAEKARTDRWYINIFIDVVWSTS